MKSNIIKKLILHAVHKCVTVYNNDVAKLFFLSKETSQCHQFSLLSFISTQKRKLEAKLEELLDSHCNLSQAIQILFNNPSAVSSLAVSEE